MPCLRQFFFYILCSNSITLLFFLQNLCSTFNASRQKLLRISNSFLFNHSIWRLWPSIYSGLRFKILWNKRKSAVLWWVERMSKILSCLGMMKSWNCWLGFYSLILLNIFFFFIVRYYLNMLVCFIISNNFEILIFGILRMTNFRDFWLKCFFVFSRDVFWSRLSLRFLF